MLMQFSMRHEHGKYMSDSVCYLETVVDVLDATLCDRRVGQRHVATTTRLSDTQTHGQTDIQPDAQSNHNNDMDISMRQ